MTEPRDRFTELLKSTTLNGIDFVEVDPGDPAILRVHFLNAVSVATPGIAAIITGGDRIPSVTVATIDNATDWSIDADGRPLLTLHLGGQGDFSDYTLSITGAPLDIFYASTRFSFKALARATSTAHLRRRSARLTTRHCRRSTIWRRTI